MAVYEYMCGSGLECLERLVETEPPLHRIVALFGLYTFYTTQPTTSHPPLHTLQHIEIATGKRLTPYPHYLHLFTYLSAFSQQTHTLLSSPSPPPSRKT